MSAKRYRYTGKERDEETGLYYHGARYYAAWLGRWTSTDPDGLIDGPNMYVYVRNAPVQNLDPNGRETFEHATEPKNAGDILTKGFDPSKGSSGYAWFEPKGQGATGGPSMEGKSAIISVEHTGKAEGTIAYTTHHQWFKEAEAALKEKGLTGSNLERAANAERWRRVGDFLRSEGKASYRIELGKGRGHFLALNKKGLEAARITRLSGADAGEVIAQLTLAGKGEAAAGAAKSAGLSAAASARFGKAASVIKWAGRPLIALAVAADAYESTARRVRPAL